jgi:hypothetical protein
MTKRAILPESDEITDHRIDLFNMDFSSISSPSLRETRKKNSKRISPRNKLAKSPKSREKTPALNPFINPEDFFEVNFIEKQEGPQCTTPAEIVHGYDGDRRRGYKKLANGIFCNREAKDGSRCFLMCQRGSRLVTSMTSKKFRCKCQGEECAWTRPIEDVQCEERRLRRKTRKLHMSDFQ